MSALPKYNLNTLGSQEFEHLCQSLVQQIIGKGAKVYGMGADGAREATFHGRAAYPSTIEQWDGSWIFQAKFHDIDQLGPKEARRRLVVELEDELSKIVEKYKHPCDNFILTTNVTLTPVYQKGIKDIIDNKILPRYSHAIKNIHVWGADEICRFLDAYPGIRQTYAHSIVSGDIIARLLGLIDSKKTDLDALVRLYCQGCFDHEKSAVLDDAGDVEDKAVALQEVFIDLEVHPQTLPQDEYVLQRLPEWLKQGAEDSERTSALSYFLDDSIPGLVLIGGPGGGKSTLGQYIAQIHRGRLNKLHDLENIQEFEKCMARVPFRILLREYAQWVVSRSDSDSLFHYLAVQISRQSGRDATPDHVHEIVKANPILLILDGLDEIPEKKLRARVLDNIASFVNQVRDILNGNIRVIATTRPYGYSDEFDPSRYLHLTLSTLSYERVNSYATKWTMAREPNPKEAERILNTLQICINDKVVNVLTQTPLQVTILLVIIRARGTPPKQREELFERYMDIIYQREQKNRPELLRTEQDIIHGLHKYLAYILHKRAEKDSTAALMDTSEFRKRVEEYLIHSDPLLKEKELETKVKQIMTEASQRLVLIESPQEGKVGFGLTTTREFFAAAHLVDTAKNTKERDARFRAITRSPHWRNVVLFFAGRVGRTRPGEAPSMIDVCREIDTEGIDKLLRRGAELVLSMVDDRVLREPHNEIGAIQQGLTLFDRGFILSRSSYNTLKNLSDQYKEHIVSPWIVQRLTDASPENIVLYSTIYKRIFGVNEILENVLERAANSPFNRVKLWALYEAYNNEIVKPWTRKLFEELIHDIQPSNIVGKFLSSHRLNYYLALYPVVGARMIITQVILTHSIVGSFHKALERLRTEILHELTIVHNKHREHLLYLFAACQLAMLFKLSSITSERRHLNWPLYFSLPSIARPVLRETLIDENSNIIRDFCATFSQTKEPLAKFLVTLFSYLLELDNVSKYINVARALEDNKLEWLKHPVSTFLGLYDNDDKELREKHKIVCDLIQHYKSERQYKKNLETLYSIINKDSINITHHGHRIFVWSLLDYAPNVEKFLDSQILLELRDWFRQNNFSMRMLSMGSWSIRVVCDLEYVKFILEITEARLKDQRNPLVLRHLGEILDYEWGASKTQDELILIAKLKSIFETVLLNDSILAGKEGEFEVLFWLALKTQIVQEEQMDQCYKILHRISEFPSRGWYAREASDAKEFLTRMLRSRNSNIVRLAAVSLVTISQVSVPYERMRIDEQWIAEKFLDLAISKEDSWHPLYVVGMSLCRLRWAKSNVHVIKAIKETDNMRLKKAWAQVIKRAGYYDSLDRDALLNLLVHILESSDIFQRSLKAAARQRLYEIGHEAQPAEFDEESLNLPLSRRTQVTSS